MKKKKKITQKGIASWLVHTAHQDRVQYSIFHVFKIITPAASDCINCLPWKVNFASTSFHVCRIGSCRVVSWYRAVFIYYTNWKRRTLTLRNLKFLCKHWTTKRSLETCWTARMSTTTMTMTVAATALWRWQRQPSEMTKEMQKFKVTIIGAGCVCIC